MRQFLIPLAATLAVLAACEAPDSTPAAEAATATNVPAATGFVTTKSAPPEGAADTRKDGVMRDADGRPFSHALLGEKLPAFTGTLADGAAFDSASIRKWTVIDVWGIWCGDCVADAPYADALARAIAQDPELAFLSVHVPASQARLSPQEMFGKYGSVDAYMREKGYTYPVVVDTDGSLRERLQIAWTPTYFLVSPDGLVRGFRTDLSVVEGEPVKDFLRDIARVRGEVIKAAASTRVPATIGPDGAMNLKSQTPFRLEAIETAFPGLTVTSETIAGGVANYPVFHVSDAETRLYTISPDWTKGYAASVSTTNTRVSGPGGERIGETKLAAWRTASGAVCTREVPHSPAVARFVCRVASSPAEFIFSVPLSAVKSPGKDGLPGFAEDPVLDEMRYLPPVPERGK